MWVFVVCVFDKVAHYAMLIFPLSFDEICRDLEETCASFLRMMVYIFENCECGLLRRTRWSGKQD